VEGGILARLLRGLEVGKQELKWTYKLVKQHRELGIVPKAAGNSLLLGKMESDSVLFRIPNSFSSIRT
jgi:hypothetical protein